MGQRKSQRKATAPVDMEIWVMIESALKAVLEWFEQERDRAKHRARLEDEVVCALEAIQTLRSRR